MHVNIIDVGGNIDEIRGYKDWMIWTIMGLNCMFWVAFMEWEREIRG